MFPNARTRLPGTAPAAHGLTRRPTRWRFPPRASRRVWVTAVPTGGVCTGGDGGDPGSGPSAPVGSTHELGTDQQTETLAPPISAVAFRLLAGTSRACSSTSRGSYPLQRECPAYGLISSSQQEQPRVFWGENTVWRSPWLGRALPGGEWSALAPGPCLSSTFRAAGHGHCVQARGNGRPRGR